MTSPPTTPETPATPGAPLAALAPMAGADPSRERVLWLADALSIGSLLLLAIGAMSQLMFAEWGVYCGLASLALRPFSNQRFVWHPFLVAIVAWVVVCIISDLVNQLTWAQAERSLGRMWRLLVPVVVLNATAIARQWRPVIVAVLLAAAGVSVLLAWYTRSSGVDLVYSYRSMKEWYVASAGVYRANGLVDHPLTLAGGMVMLAVFGLGLAVHGSSWKWRWRLALLAAVPVLLVGLVAAGSRGYYLVFAAVALLLLFTLRGRWLLGGALMLLLAIVAVGSRPEMQDRFARMMPQVELPMPERPMIKRRVMVHQLGPPTTVVTLREPDGSETRLSLQHEVDPREKKSGPLFDGTYTSEDGETAIAFRRADHTFEIRQDGEVVEAGRFIPRDAGTAVEFYQGDRGWMHVHFEEVDRVARLYFGVQVVRDYPLFGVGRDHDSYWREFYKRAQPWRDAHGHRFGGFHVHNTWLQIAIEAGLIGLLAYTAIFIALIRTFILRAMRSAMVTNDAAATAWSLGGLLVVVAFMAAGLFEHNWADSEVQVLLWLLVGISLWPTATEESSQRQRTPWPVTKWGVAFLAMAFVLIVSAVGTMFNYPESVRLVGLVSAPRVGVAIGLAVLAAISFAMVIRELRIARAPAGSPPGGEEQAGTEGA